MTITYSAGLKNTRMQAVINALDIGTAGSLELCSSGFASVLATLTLQHPSFSLSSAVITLLGVPLVQPSAANTGTVAAARFKDSTGNVVINNLTVGIGSGDIQMVNTAVIAGQSVTITRGTITHG